MLNDQRFFIIVKIIKDFEPAKLIKIQEAIYAYEKNHQKLTLTEFNTTYLDLCLSEKTTRRHYDMNFVLSNIRYMQVYQVATLDIIIIFLLHNKNLELALPKIFEKYRTEINTPFGIKRTYGPTFIYYRKPK